MQAPFFCPDRTCSSVDCDVRDSLAALTGGNADTLPPVIVFATDNTTTDAVTGKPTIVTPGDGVNTVDYGVPVTEYYLSPATAAASWGESQ